MNENGTGDWIEAARMYRAMAEELQGIPGSEKMLEDVGRAVVEGARAAFDAKLSGDSPATQGAWPFRKVAGRPKRSDPRVEKDLKILGVEAAEAVAVAGTAPVVDARTARILRDTDGPKRLCRKSEGKGRLRHISDAPAGWISVRKAMADALKGWGKVDQRTLTNLLKQSSRRATAIGLEELGNPWVAEPAVAGGKLIPKFFASMGTDDGDCYCYPPGEPSAILRRAVSEIISELLWTTTSAGFYLGVTANTIRTRIDKGELGAVKDNKDQWRLPGLLVKEYKAVVKKEVEEVAKQGAMAELIEAAQAVRTTGGLAGLAKHAEKRPSASTT